MPTLNPYFRNFTYGREQRLVENLVIESIKQYGVETYYIPAKRNNINNIFGEDATTSYEQFTRVEMYIKNPTGFEGEGRFLSKFGFEVRESMELIVATRRFKQISNNKLYLENGYLLLNEEADQTGMDTGIGFKLEAGNLTPFDIDYEKPKIGDLIYLPLADKYFEIKFVKDYDEVFFQLGKIPFYSLQVEVFEYSHENIETGDTTVDLLAELNGSTDAYELLNEDGSKILGEDGTSLILDNALPAGPDPSANNASFRDHESTVIDFSEQSPFVLVGATKSTAYRETDSQPDDE